MPGMEAYTIHDITILGANETASHLYGKPCDSFVMPAK